MTNSDHEQHSTIYFKKGPSADYLAASTTPGTSPEKVAEAYGNVLKATHRGFGHSGIATVEDYKAFDKKIYDSRRDVLKHTVHDKDLLNAGLAAINAAEKQSFETIDRNFAVYHKIHDKEAVAHGHKPLPQNQMDIKQAVEDMRASLARHQGQELNSHSAQNPQHMSQPADHTKGGRS